MNKFYVHNLRKQENGKVKAYADITVGNAITLRGIKLIAGEEGEFVAMPSRRYEKDGETKYANIFHLKSEEAQTVLLETFRKAYEAENGYAYSSGDVNPEFDVTISAARSSSTNLKAWATLAVGDDFIIPNIAINETSKGLMVNFPSKKYEKDGETKYTELVALKKAEWTDKDGKACSKDYEKIVCGLIINAYKPTLSQQIDNADKIKNNSADMQKNIPEQDIQK